jgi:hypothetical protein
MILTVKKICDWCKYYIGGDIKEIVYTICGLCRVSIVEDCDVSSYAAVNGNVGYSDDSVVFDNRQRCTSLEGSMIRINENYLFILLAANWKKKLMQKSKKMFPTTQKRHMSPFGSCIHLLKISLGLLVVLPIQFPRVGIFGPIF